MAKGLALTNLGLGGGGRSMAYSRGGRQLTFVTGEVVTDADFAVDGYIDMSDLWKEFRQGELVGFHAETHVDNDFYELVLARDYKEAWVMRKNHVFQRDGIDIPEVAANSTVNFDVANTGKIVAGGRLQGVVRQRPHGLIIEVEGVAPATDTIRLRVSNYTAAPINPGPLTVDLDYAWSYPEGVPADIKFNFLAWGY